MTEAEIPKGYERVPTKDKPQLLCVRHIASGGEAHVLSADFDSNTVEKVWGAYFPNSGPPRWPLRGRRS